jgi:sugar lactone lactonase YvrE
MRWVHNATRRRDRELFAPGGTIAHEKESWMKTRDGLALASAVAAIALLGAPAAAQGPTVEVLAEGLNAPRGLLVAPDGSIWVAEAGAAGETCMETPRGEACYGPSGAVAKIADGSVERVIEGLTSAGAGPEIGGISDIALAEDGSLYLLMNLGDDPAVRAQMPPDFATAGWLMKAAADGTTEPFADIAAFESSDNPEPAAVDSNPYSVAVTDGGFVIADAGGNDLLMVDESGAVSLIATFPPFEAMFPAEMLAAMGPPPEGEGGPPAEASESSAPEDAKAMESAAPAEAEAPAEAASGAPAAGEMVPLPVEWVPTSVVVGPDGAYYVGQLTGGPFPIGGASVLRVDPATGETSTYATGFTNIIDIAFGPDGTLYVAEIVHDGLMGVFAAGAAPVGALLSVPPGGGEPQVLVNDESFMAPGGLAVDGDGAIYASLNTLAPGAGSVVKITP